MNQFQRLLARAIAGEADCYPTIGYYHYWGRDGVKIDRMEAGRWFMKALAVKENEGAIQYHAGLCYLNGYGVEQDNRLGFLCFKRAAELRCGAAYFKLGQCYRDGTGIEEDHVKAFEWLTKAASIPNEQANYGGEVECALALAYHCGIGTPQNTEKAMEWYKKCLSHTDSPPRSCIDVAKWNLMLCYRQQARTLCQELSSKSGKFYSSAREALTCEGTHCHSA